LKSVPLPLEAVAVFKLMDNVSQKIDEALSAAAPFISNINELCSK